MATIHIFGRLTADPETRLLPNNGGTVTSFTLADNHGKDSNGQDKASFFRCSAFGKQAELIFSSCKKGHRLNVSGRFESRPYQANDGSKAVSLDVSVNAFDFVEPRDQTAQAAPAAPAQQPAAAQQVGQPAYQRDQAGNYWQNIGGQMVMTHNAQGQPVQRPAAPPAQAAPAAPVYPPQQFAPPAAMAPQFAPLPQGACPPNERPF